MHLTALRKAARLFINNQLRSLPVSKMLLVMKLTTIILFAACLHASAAGYGQRVSISGENLPLKSVFTKIQKQTGYLFFYYKEDLEKA